jgi:hypothetical protein
MRMASWSLPDLKLRQLAFQMGQQARSACVPVDLDSIHRGGQQEILPEIFGNAYRSPRIRIGVFRF